MTFTAAKRSFRPLSGLLNTELNSSPHARSVLLRCGVYSQRSSGGNARNQGVRSISSSAPKQAVDATASTANHKPLTAEQREFLSRALRVNQAGELAAVLIYDAQTPPIVKQNPKLKGLMKHMYDQEAGHFKTFNELIAKHRIRPTAMYPLWRIAATGLGWSTAVMGREAAMACTEAVETEIGDHYNRQVSMLMQWAKDIEAKGEVVSEEMKELLDTLRRIRDEELEHLDHAVENDAKEAKPYELLTGVIRGGCRAAIWITERV